MSSQPEDFYRETLKDALSKLQSTLPDDPQAIIAHLEVAQAYRQTEDIETADRYFEKSLQLFSSTEPASELDGEELWNYLASTNLATFDRYFPILFEACEKVLAAKGSSRGLIQALLSTHIDIAELPQLAVTYLPKAIEIRQAARGGSHDSLVALLLLYIWGCERLGCIEHAEEIEIKLLKFARNDYYLVPQLARCYLGLANLYLSNDMLDKADNAWLNALTLESSAPSLQLAETFANLVQRYQQMGATQNIEKMIDTWLTNATEESLRSIDPHFSQLVNTNLNSGSLMFAQGLIEKRLNAFNTHVVDYALNDWRLRLSEVYLRSGRTSDSAQLFELAITSMSVKNLCNSLFHNKKTAPLERRKPLEAESMQREVSPKTISNPVEIRFGFFATQEIRFGRNTRFRYFDPEPDVLAKIISAGETYEVAICCLGTIHCEGNLEIAGSIYGMVEPSDTIRRQPLVTAPLPQDLKPLLPALEQPQSAIIISYPHRIVKSGDYVAATINKHFSIRDSSEAQPIRIFLKDDEDENDQPYIFDGRRSILGIYKNKAVNLQLWYNGTKKLSIPTMSALVYAPNATVEIARDSRFCGAIVANRIIAEGNNEISIDLSLTREIFQT